MHTICDLLRLQKSKMNHLLSNIGLFKKKTQAKKLPQTKKRMTGIRITALRSNKESVHVRSKGGAHKH